MKKNLPGNILIISALLCLCDHVSAQQITDPDSFLVNRDSVTKVFLAGSFHFQYYNEDAYKIDKDKQIDILSAQKQKELKQLLDYLSLFRPTKIIIEATPGWKAMDRYREYKAGKRVLGKDERYQIAFRLMDRFNLDTVFSVDAETVVDEILESKDSSLYKPLMDSIYKDYAFRSNQRYLDYLDYKTTLSTKLPLLEYFKFINSPKNLQRDYGSYLLGDFRLGTFRGADGLAMFWYDRNLRIFRNIQRIGTSRGDRLLVLFGSGHIAVLDNLFSCSPEYDYTRFNDLEIPHPKSGRRHT